jgi:hopanoid biosynthesis associated protein HpnK
MDRSLPDGCRLIINVDDFGLSTTVNEAVCALYEEGVVTSTSLMTATPALEDAVGRALATPGLAVGLHLALIHAPAQLSKSEVPHLVERSGELSRNAAVAGLRYTLHPRCRRELQAEIEAQFAAFAATDLPMSHVDSHLHFHLTPVIFRHAVAGARRSGAAGFRIPLDDLPLYSRLDPEDARKQAGLHHIFRVLSARQRRIVEAAGLVTTHACLGTFRTGRLEADYLVRLVSELPDGDFELHCHPDLGTPAGLAEFEALRSAQFRRALNQRGIRLATYGSLKSRT